MSAHENPEPITCYVEDCDDPVTELLRLHLPGQETKKEVLACEKHAALLRMMAL